ncbi:histidine kinase [Microbacterium horticulturae]|uniref:histidine kinase n=1 Tax=Microbacterium horticulturae TaxID=3028316 RepID=A0ABY8BVT1_9MICO|nr:sensor histidine kinase [Microbacterium sp. KACC 23027]WEG08271.1 histidine kinase [Microbacterium sp. KACC 23027]
MTSTTTDKTPRLFTPTRVLGAIAQMAAVGVAWAIAFGVLFALLAAGIGLLFAIGIGLIVLLGLVYAMFALAWLETARVDGLYGFGIAPLPARTSGRPGFTGWLRTVWLQFSDGRMWRGIGSAAVSAMLGWATLSLLSIMASGVAMVFTPLVPGDPDTIPLRGAGWDVPAPWAVGVGIIAALVAIAGLIGLAALHGVLTRAILVPSREVQLAAEARTAQAQRGGAVRAADVERTRIERDLHDGVQPRLVSVGMTLGMAQQKIDDDPEAAKQLIAEAHTSTKAAITELRQLARGIHTSILDDRGLDAALSALAARSPIPVQLDSRLTQRCSPQTETAVYYVIAESLTNAAKHSRAAECRVIVRQREGGILWARVEDNGIGGATVVPGGGLDGLSNRVLGVGGTLTVTSPIGGPTTVEVSVPCAY